MESVDLQTGSPGEHWTWDNVIVSLDRAWQALAHVSLIECWTGGHVDMDVCTLEKFLL